jgi:tetratricopeptide (TPR) repeat protein
MQQEEQEQPESEILLRAKKAIDENNRVYARFLYREALSIDPQDNAARAELHKLREGIPIDDSAFSKIKFVFGMIKVVMYKILSDHDSVITASEQLLDIIPDSSFALASMLNAADKAGYHKIITFLSEKIRDGGCTLEDLVIIARAFLNEKMFDQSAKVAKEATDIDPENEDAKDILWQASIEKHANSDVTLVTAGGEKRFIPPKIDAEKIFIASHKEEKDDKKDDKKGDDKKN